jgi:hypothetical protein
MQRPRPIFLGLLVVIVALVIIYAVWPAASQRVMPSNQTREGRTQAGRGAAGSAEPQPGQLDVKLEALNQPPPSPEDPARNPFRFYVKPPPPPPPPKPVPAPPPPPVDPNYVPPPPPPPPIPLKFIGTLEQGTKKVAIFSDGRGLPLYGKEGETILGQYRIVKIGVESVVMEYLDGRGRQTIPMRGASSPPPEGATVN